MGIDCASNPDLDRLTGLVIGAAIEVHRALGQGLLESVYQASIYDELRLRDVAYESQVEIPLRYKGLDLDRGFRFDRVVDDLIVVEIKAVEKALPVHNARLLSCLRLSRLKLGLLVNLNVPLLRDGVKRKVLGL